MAPMLSPDSVSLETNVKRPGATDEALPSRMRDVSLASGFVAEDVPTKNAGALPATSRFLFGVVVPMPTLSVEVVRRTTVPSSVHPEGEEEPPPPVGTAHVP